jgi:hypothetical protein
MFLGATTSFLQPLGDGVELLPGRLQVVGDLLCQHFGVGQVVGVLQALVLEPEKIEVRLVALGQLVVTECPPARFGPLVAPGRFALVPLPRLETIDEFVEVRSLVATGTPRGARA